MLPQPQINFSLKKKKSLDEEKEEAARVKKLLQE
jgi:hypothetical protein